MFSQLLEIMKDALKEKFKSNAVVKPLYRKIKNNNKIKPRMFISVDSTFELDGHAVSFKKDVLTGSPEVHRLKNINKRKEMLLRDTCATHNKDDNFEKNYEINGPTNNVAYELKGKRMLGYTKSKINEIKHNIEDKSVQTDTNKSVFNNVPNTWLRLYPMPKLPQESLCSVIFRCILCQLGISTFLVIWTSIFMFSISCFEGPYEMKWSTDFEKQQNQLVIDLATELRQITPISPRWKAAIEQRITEARQMTSFAALHGARLRPGRYWDLSGTFLFTVYVMTALGFGAPVPQTIEGRTLSLLYAVLAVPSHIYLMINASRSLVAHTEAYIKQIRFTLQDKRFIGEKYPLENVKDSLNCSRNSVLLKTQNRCTIGMKIMRILCTLGPCSSVPLAGLLYYVVGACIFGVLQHLKPLDTIMFPLGFTISGGLDLVEGHVRVLYGFYVEGAMVLIACALATVRRQSSSGIEHISNKYRLFAVEK